MSGFATRPVLILAAGFVAIVIAGALAVSVLQNRSPSQVPLSSAMINVDGAEIGGPFTLTAQTGDRMTDQQVIDGPTLVYFGYTYCPDICPIDVQIMVDAVDILAEQGIAVRPVFITIDPARDTPAELAAYADAMHPKLLALSGSEAEIKATADAYKVYYQKSGEGDDYLLSHTGYLYLMTPQSGITALFRRDVAPEQIADDIRRVLSAMKTVPAG